MTSKTEEIALRLWKLKSSTIDITMFKGIPSARSINNDDDDESASISSDTQSKHYDERSQPAEYDRHSSKDNDNDSKSGDDDDDKVRKSAGVEELKPTQSYIALIATAILKSSEKRLVLSDIYKYILDNYSYFQSQDKSWRNSIRHNLSLNECFIKVGRSEQGKGHYWAIHPANYDDFSQGDFRRRRARRRVRRSFINSHPYSGYLARPYSGMTRSPMNCISDTCKDTIELRRRIHPFFYGSEFYPAGKSNSLIMYSKFQSPPRNSIYKAEEPYKPMKAVWPTMKDTRNESATSPPLKTSPKAAAFSIDSILGNKTHTDIQRELSPPPLEKSIECMDGKMRDFKLIKGLERESYFPYYHRDLKYSRVSNDKIYSSPKIAFRF